MTQYEGTKLKLQVGDKMRHKIKKIFLLFAGLNGLIFTPLLFPIGHFFNDVELNEDWKSYKGALIQMIFNYNTIEGKWEDK